jgi:hypothetical protein
MRYIRTKNLIKVKGSRLHTTRAPREVPLYPHDGFVAHFYHLSTNCLPLVAFACHNPETRNVIFGQTHSLVLQPVCDLYIKASRCKGSRVVMQEILQARLQLCNEGAGLQIRRGKERAHAGGGTIYIAHHLFGRVPLLVAVHADDMVIFSCVHVPEVPPDIFGGKLHGQYRSTALVLMRRRT